MFIDCFYYNFAKNIIQIFTNAYNIKLKDYKDVLDDTNCYLVLFDKLVSLIFKDN